MGRLAHATATGLCRRGGIQRELATVARRRDSEAGKVMARKTAKVTGWNRALAYPIKPRDQVRAGRVPKR